MKTTFRQIRLFHALAETGSVSGAARVMHVTQPTASMQLKEISHAIGLPLYEVIGKKVHLTEAGQELAVTARALVSEWESFQQRVDELKGLSRGKLHVAVVSTAKYFMPRMIGSFCKKYPGIDVALEILNRDGVVQRLQKNLDDLYIMSMPPVGMDLHDELLMPNPIVVIAPNGDALTRQKNIVLSDLKNCRLILREPGSGTRMAADKYFSKKKFKPNIRLELGSNEAVKESVAGGLGIGVISQHALHGMDKEHGVRVVHVEGFPLPSAWHMVHHANQKLSPATLAFRKHMLKEMGQMPSEAKRSRSSLAR